MVRSCLKFHITAFIPDFGLLFKKRIFERKNR